MHVYGQIYGTLTAGATITGTLSAPAQLQGTVTIPAAILPASYPGPTTVTPTQGTQVLETDNLFMRDNVTINPIPSNYGLITWDGSTLTVS